MFRPLIASLVLLSTQPLFGGVSGGVKLDGSFGAKGALPGPNFMIPASVGKQVGGNLFQSFSQFDLTSTQSATFTGPPNVQNILSRVTSGSPSSIDGTVNSQIQGANLFFLNPAGVMFGPHAQLDVSGSVAISTANYVKMVGGGRFNANLGGQDSLTSAPVSAFGFLSTAPAPVSIMGSNTVDPFGNPTPGKGLSVAPGKSFSVVAGNIGAYAGYINGQGSRVNLVSVRSSGEVQLDATDVNTPINVTPFTAMGDVQLTFSVIDTSGPGGGPVLVRGGNLLWVASQILSTTSGAVQGGPINIVASGSGIIFGTGTSATIDSSTTGSGNSGDINLTAKSVFLGLAEIFSVAQSSGNAGTLTIVTDSLQLADTFIATDGLGPGPGNAGDINITAKSVTLDISDISSSGRIFGNGGTVTLVTDTLLLTNSSQIMTDAEFGTSNAGAINVTAKSSITLNNSTIESRVLDPAIGGGAGNAGTVTLVTDTLLLTDLSSITTDAVFTAGNAGDINVTAKSITLNNSGFASSTSGGSGNAGTMTILTNDLQLTGNNGSFIKTETAGRGKGGNINVTAKSVSLSSNGVPSPDMGIDSIISADAFDTGNAGRVTVVTDKLQLANGSTIDSSTFDSNNTGNNTGNAGDVIVNAKSITIDGAGAPAGATGIFAKSGQGSFGKGGSIFVNGSQLLVLNGGVISASSVTAAPAGSVQLNLGTLCLDSNSNVLSENTGSGIAGGVLVDTTGLIELSHGSSISTSARHGNAGDIMVQTDDLAITGGGEISSTTFGEGNGGSINVTANSLFVDRGSSNSLTGITAQAEIGSSGNGGNIGVQSGQLTLVRGGEISAKTDGSGNGGSIHVDAQSILVNASEITATTTGNGNGGDVTIAADTLQVDNSQVHNSFSAIDTSTDGGSGNGGNINVTARSVSLNSAQFVAETLGAGNGGTINVTADMVTLTGRPREPRTGFNADTLGLGTGGNINVSASSIVLHNGALMTDAFDRGKGGNINVTAKSVSLNNNAAISAASAGAGHGGTVNIMSDVLRVDFALISTSAFSTGDGGNVNVIADNLELSGFGAIESSTDGSIDPSSRNFGNAGDVFVNATSILINGAGRGRATMGILAASRKGSTGNGGNVMVKGDRLLLEHGGAISTSSSSAARAGSVQLALGTLTMESDSSISSANTLNGAAGDVIISASGPVTLRHRSDISVASQLSSAGDIDLFSDGVIKLSSGSSITASAGTDGGNIHLRAPELVYLKDSSITAEAGPEKNGSGFAGTGGNITIDPRFIVLKNSRISANAAFGQGGKIDLISDFFFNSNSLITATGPINNGTINITAPELDLGAELITLPSSLVDVETQLQERCTALLQGDFSSFIIVGRGGTESPPDELQPAF